MLKEEGIVFDAELNAYTDENKNVVELDVMNLVDQYLNLMDKYDEYQLVRQDDTKSMIKPQSTISSNLARSQSEARVSQVGTSNYLTLSALELKLNEERQAR